MRAYWSLFTFVLLLLIGGSSSAQEGKGWLGTDVLDVTKAEADKLGWDTPHGAKVGGSHRARLPTRRGSSQAILSSGLNAP
jgi:hypothetical protein